MNGLKMGLAAATLAAAACTSTGSNDTLASVGTGAAVGAGVGAGAGAIIGGLTPIEGAIIGAAAGGLIGAVWADRDGDDRADGYYHNGRYYPGVPPSQPAYQEQAWRSGERG